MQQHGYDSKPAQALPLNLQLPNGKEKRLALRITGTVSLFIQGITESFAEYMLSKV